MALDVRGWGELSLIPGAAVAASRQRGRAQPARAKSDEGASLAGEHGRARERAVTVAEWVQAA